MRAAVPVRFGPFAADFQTGILTRNGIRVNLQEQPFQVLRLLVERPGSVITREELRERLWRGNPIADTDDGVSTAIRKIRAALCDSTANPRFIETVPKRGYRFIAQVETPCPPEASLAPDPNPAPQPEERSRSRFAVLPLLALGVLAVAGFSLFRPARSEATFAAPMHALAIIPIENISGDPAQDYLASGLSEQILTDLAKLPGLRVTSRGSALRYQHTTLSAREIGKELGVDAVVEGSISRAANHVHLMLRLLLAATGQSIWAESFNRDTTDILEFEEWASAALAREVQARQHVPHPAPLAFGNRVKPEVYDLYLRALQALRARRSFDEMIETFQRTIDADAKFAPAYAGLADALTVRAMHAAPAERQNRFDEVIAAAENAIELDPSLGEPHGAIAAARFFGSYDFQRAGPEFARALQLNPNDAETRHWYAYWLAATGRLPEAVAQERRALQQDPFSFAVHTTLGELLYQDRTPAECIAASRASLRLFGTGAWYLHANIALCHELNDSLDEAAEEWMMALTPHKLLSHRATLLAILKQAHEDEARGVSPPVAVIAQAAAIAGDEGETRHWLNRALELRENIPFIFLKVDPAYDRMRALPWFQDLLRQIHLVP